MSLLSLDIFAFLPEIIIGLGILTVLFIGLFRREKESIISIFHYANVVLLLSLLSLYMVFPSSSKALFDVVYFSSFTQVSKMLLAMGGCLILYVSRQRVDYELKGIFEYPILILFVVLGGFVLISARDLMAVYLGLELQSLALYILCGSKRSSKASTEAALKYFVLGALSSGIFLFGASLMYGVVGDTNFVSITSFMAKNDQNTLLFQLGIVMVIIAFLFKTSVVPFHMWTPDVYQGSQTSVTLLLSTIAKIAPVTFLMYAYYHFVDANMSMSEGTKHLIQYMLSGMAVLSVVIGSLAGLRQTHLKRLLAYSTITHSGYILMGIISDLSAAFLYLVVYIVSSVFLFLFVFSLQKLEDNKNDIPIKDLAGLSQDYPYISFGMSVALLSMAGLPPLAGFLGKFFVLSGAVKSGFSPQVVLMLLMAVVSVSYYLKIIKTFYFDDKAEVFSQLDFQLKLYNKKTSVLGVLLLIVFFLLPFLSFPLLKITDEIKTSFMQERNYVL